MEKRMMLCLVAVLVVFTGTGVVHGWPWSKKTQDNVPQQQQKQKVSYYLPVELTNYWAAGTCYAWGYDENSLRKALARELEKCEERVRFNVVRDMPTLLWIGKDWSGKGDGTVYIINPQYYEKANSVVRLGTDEGKIYDRASIGLQGRPIHKTRFGGYSVGEPIESQWYRGGIIFGGPFRR